MIEERDDYDDDDDDDDCDGHDGPGCGGDVTNPWVAMAVFERQRCLGRVYAAVEIVSREYPDVVLDVRCAGICNEFMHSDVLVHAFLRNVSDEVSDDEFRDDATDVVLLLVGSSQFEIERKVRTMVEVLNQYPLKEVERPKPTYPPRPVGLSLPRPVVHGRPSVLPPAASESQREKVDHGMKELRETLEERARRLEEELRRRTSGS